MDNDKNIDRDQELDHKEDTSSDGANRARNRTVMLTPEVTGQVRALLNQDRPSDLFQAPTRQTVQPDPFTPVHSASNPMTGLITRDGVIEPAKAPEPPAVSTPRSSAATNAPIDPALIQSARSNSVGIVSEKLTPIVGFLVSYDGNPAGEVLELRSGRWIVSSERASDGNFLIIKDASVSPLHAILKISEAGEVQVLDQLSEHGTEIEHLDGEKEVLNGSMGNIEHGETITFGKRSFSVCIVRKG